MITEEGKKLMDGMGENPEMPDNTETSAASTETQTGNNELIDIINRFAPGQDTSTPEAQLSAALTVLKSLVPIYDKVYDLALTNPETAAMLNDWLETGELAKAIARNYDPEEIKALVEELEDDGYEEDKMMYAERTKSRKELDEKRSTNIKNSQMSAQQFVDKYELDEAKIEAFKPFVDKFLTDAEDRNLSLANWEILWNAFTKDDAVSEAEANGRVMGRNEQIVAKKRSREDLKDVLPGVNATASITPQMEKPKSFASSFLDGTL